MFVALVFQGLSECLSPYGQAEDYQKAEMWEDTRIYRGLCDIFLGQRLTSDYGSGKQSMNDAQERAVVTSLTIASAQRLSLCLFLCLQA